MNLNKILSILLAVSVFAALIGCSSGGLEENHNPVPNRAQTTFSNASSKSDTVTDYKAQARQWLDNEDLWSNKSAMPSSGISGVYSTGYYFFDIDLDGEKELLVQLGGDQTQACKTLVYKLKNGELTQLNADKLNLSVQNLTLWINDKGEKFYINEHTLIGENEAFITSWKKLIIKDGVLSEEPIAFMHMTYDKLTGNMDTMQYYEADGKKAISDDAYLALVDSYYAGCTQVHIEPNMIKSTAWQYYTHNQKINAIADELKK